MEESLRKFAEENFSHRYFPALHGEIKQIQPLALAVKRNRPLWKRPFAKSEVIILAELAKYVKNKEPEEFRKCLESKIKEEMFTSNRHETIALEARERNLDVGVGRILEGTIRLSNEMGVLKLGKLSQKYIDDPDLRGLLARTDMDDKMMESFAEGDKLLLITSVIYSEKFEQTGERKQEAAAEVTVDGSYGMSPFFQFFKSKVSFRKTTHPSELASRTANAPLLFKCCNVDYIKGENRLEIIKGEYVGKVVTRDTTVENPVKGDDEDYKNTLVEISSEETDAPAPLTPEDVKKLDSMLKNVLLPVKSLKKRKENAGKYLRWFEAAMASDQEKFLIHDSVTQDDCELLRFAFLSASEGSTLLDMSSLTKPDIQGYAVVFKHLFDLTDEKWRKLEQRNAEDD